MDKSKRGKAHANHKIFGGGLILLPLMAIATLSLGFSSWIIQENESISLLEEASITDAIFVSKYISILSPSKKIAYNEHGFLYDGVFGDKGEMTLPIRFDIDAASDDGIFLDESNTINSNSYDKALTFNLYFSYVEADGDNIFEYVSVNSSPSLSASYSCSNISSNAVSFSSSVDSSNSNYLLTSISLYFDSSHRNLNAQQAVTCYLYTSFNLDEGSDYSSIYSLINDGSLSIQVEGELS